MITQEGKSGRRGKERERENIAKQNAKQARHDWTQKEGTNDGRYLPGDIT